ncbi:formate dehydrogenase subunit delta [Labrys sp. LIt4]|uniref:Formate dehydrogenase n=1 Tax=Labrys okinawensis TaxID=346911 RepID=A0A2S9Q9X7_9HYPH|nr:MULTISPECIES: formate dehydrogenase subunit delta [Labrys]MBP0581574.1 formate dehydrogenase subunit delta [Labrys sp. LIt4]PRH86134.1 formate dehydrogenase [Labrys okinawensis]
MSPDESVHEGHAHDPVAKLVRMANQIGLFFASQREDVRIPGIADHIRKFWEPRMRNRIFAHLDAGGEGIDPLVRKALESLREKA